MNNKNIEKFLIKYPKVKEAILYCFENDKNYGWFCHYKDDKKLGAKPNKISKPTSF